MSVSDLRGYGVAVSDLEASWSPALKKEMKRKGVAVVLAHLGLVERLRFLWAFLGARRRAAALDLRDLCARGMNNEVFLATQREYLALYAALVAAVGAERAQQVATALMDATAREPMLLLLPNPEEVRANGDPLEVMGACFRAMPAAACKAGCQEITLREDEPGAIGFDVTWCVWLELARKMGSTSATLPECYADGIAFPAYFRSLGLEYRRTGTLASGARCCDFRFARLDQGAESRA